ncbi:sensor histidine kinase [Sulfurimonas sp.]|nr:sensor histidine kinase [Sulfurimonas sp.]
MNSNKYNYLTILLIFISFVITTYFSYYSAQQSLEQQSTKQNIPLTLKSIKASIQNDLGSKFLLSRSMAENEFLISWIKNGEKESSKVESYLSSMLAYKDIFTSYVISDTSKRYYHSKKSIRYIDENNPDEQWYVQTKNSEFDHEVSISSDENNNNTLTFFINYKILDTQNKFLGITGVGIKMSNVIQLINEYKKSFNKDIYIVDVSGHVLLSNKEVTKLDFMKNDLKKHSYTSKRNDNLLYVSYDYIEELKLFIVVQEQQTPRDTSIFHTMLINMLIVIVLIILIIYITYKSIKKYQEKEFSKVTKTISFIMHQWKQPISVLASYIMTAQQKLMFNPEQNIEYLKEDIDKIEHKLLDISKTTDVIYNLYMKSHINKKHINISRTINKLLNDDKIKLQTKNIKITFDPIQNFTLYGDEALLYNILLNLLQNAIDAFTDTKDNTIIITTNIASHNEKSLQIQDNAGGIQSQDINTIFHTGFTTKSKGSGLGLPFVRESLSYVFNAKIKVLNNENGAVFTINFS